MTLDDLKRLAGAASVDTSLRGVIWMRKVDAIGADPWGKTWLSLTV